MTRTVDPRRYAHAVTTPETPASPPPAAAAVPPASASADAPAATPAAAWPPNPHARGWRRRLGEFVLSGPVQAFVLVVIVLNAAVLGLQTSPDVVAAVGPALALLDAIALGIFVVELALKIVALDARFFRDGWNVFDLLVVVIALLPAVGPFAVLRALRVLRVLRLVNRMPQLRRIATAIIQAVPGIGAIAGLMVLVFYVSAVMATTLFGERFPEWFGSVPASLYSLFQVMTLESWSMGIVRPVMAVYPEAWAFFVPFILISAFVMLNLFVAVIVDTMSNLGASERGTVADPAPVREGARPLEHGLFSAERELAAMRGELAEIRALLVRREGGRPPRTGPVPTAGGPFSADRELAQLREEVAASRGELADIRTLLERRD